MEQRQHRRERKPGQIVLRRHDAVRPMPAVQARHRRLQEAIERDDDHARQQRQRGAARDARRRRHEAPRQADRAVHHQHPVRGDEQRHAAPLPPQRRPVGEIAEHRARGDARHLRQQDERIRRRGPGREPPPAGGARRQHHEHARHQKENRNQPLHPRRRRRQRVPDHGHAGHGRQHQHRGPHVQPPSARKIFAHRPPLSAPGIPAPIATGLAFSTFTPAA